MQVLRILLPGSVRDDSIQQDFSSLDAGLNVNGDIGLFRFKIEEFLHGGAAEFSLEDVHLNPCPAFQKKVLFRTWNIPRGKVMSYGFLSKTIGCLGGARAVGAALSKNPLPLVIPCHRVIRENRSLGGFGGGLTLKRKLLEMEGIHFDSKGKVLREYFYP